uniref:Putative secreted protein n=1 Tax=Anopheles marajoara TaxID=58244 RepID=A0A2M4CA15_9DIPT
MLLLICFVYIFLYRLRHTTASDGTSSKCNSSDRRGHRSGRMTRFDVSSSRTGQRGIVVHATSQCLPLRILALVYRWYASSVAVRYGTGTITRCCRTCR